jgi:hemin uptake protein HemP
MRPGYLEESPATPAQPIASRPLPAAERVVSTRELLGGAHRLWIEHAAERYLLQVTRSGKLILTK